MKIPGLASFAIINFVNLGVALLDPFYKLLMLFYYTTGLLLMLFYYAMCTK